MTDTPDIIHHDIPAINVTDNTVVATYDGRNIEELIGFVEEEYQCSYSGVNGTLYAGTDGLAFLGKFFLFDKKMYVKWPDVKVQQTDQGGGISVQTRDKDQPTIHEFIGIQNVERVWSTLRSLHNQALLDQPTSSSADGTSSDPTMLGGDSSSAIPTTRARAATAQPIHRRQLRRMTSDPQKLAPAIEALFAPDSTAAAAAEDSTTDTTQSDKKPVSTSAMNGGGGGGDGSSSDMQRRPSSMRLLKPLEDLKKELTAVATSSSSATTPSTTTNNKNNSLGVVQVSPVSEIEAIVGKVSGEYSCRYNGQKGTLHAGSTALYFAGERLFFPARLKIQSTHIRQVQMTKGKEGKIQQQRISTEDVIKEQGIVIWTHEGISHTFLGMESPDQVWASLVALRNHVSASPNSPNQRPFGMSRSNSDPNFQSNTGMQLISSPSQDGGDSSMALEMGGGGGEQSMAPPALSEEELKKAWSEVTSKKNRYAGSVVKDHEYACTLDRFFKQYIGDDAEFSIGKFMETFGEKDVKTSSWKPSEQDGKLVRKRTVRYVHPINAPMAPPEAEARKEQTYQRFGDLGFLVETKTIVVGVPMTDCFFVKDKLIVARAPTNGKVLMSLEFELEFVKSTMFRGLITKTTNGEMSKFFDQLQDYMAKSLGEEVIPQKEEEKEEKNVVVDEVGSQRSLTMMRITHGLLFVVLGTQLWMLTEIYSMKHAMTRIESAQCKPVLYSNQ